MREGSQFERRLSLEVSPASAQLMLCPRFLPRKLRSRTEAAQSELSPKEEAPSLERLPDAGHGCLRGHAPSCAHVLNCLHRQAPTTPSHPQNPTLHAHTQPSTSACTDPNGLKKSTSQTGTLEYLHLKEPTAECTSYTVAPSLQPFPRGLLKPGCTLLSQAHTHTLTLNDTCL